MTDAAPIPRAHPVWRSLLYVPAHVERFVERAHTRGADCIQLDLEDSVPAAETDDRVDNELFFHAKYLSVGWPWTLTSPSFTYRTGAFAFPGSVSAPQS